ncbi:MAG: type II methionyl aminopeptidase [bacterium]
MEENKIKDKENEENEEENKEENKEKYYEKAGGIIKRIFRDLKIEEGMGYKEIAERIEKEIYELNGNPAFPVNISCNEVAAHDTCDKNDERKICGIVKIDVGVHVDGYVADFAVTYDFTNENGKLLEASKEALENAISKVRSGLRISELGKEIEYTIKKYGFKPIQNLGGHRLERFRLHCGEIPNYEVRSNETLNEGDVIAIEPFSTNGVGFVKETNICKIYSIDELKPTRNAYAREFFKLLEERYKNLPFAERWVIKDQKDKIALIELIRNGSLKRHPVLKEKENGLVSQFETTVIVEKDSGKVLI